MFEDFFNINFIGQAATLTMADILTALTISFAIGMFIFFVYIKTFKGVMHSSSFAVSLIAMNMITALVILAVAQQLIIALGMVGALSIVRFRTVVKEPLDLVFLFWSITIGIIVGAGLIMLAVVGSIIIGAIMFVMIGHKTKEIPYIVVIHCVHQKAGEKCLDLLNDKTQKNVVKSKSVSKTGLELTVEVRLKNSSTEFIDELLKIKDVNNATLVSFNGDYYM